MRRATPQPAPRIVSLLPSATEIVCALGLRDHLVGVTHECDYPGGVERLPKVTRTRIPTDASSGEIDALVREQRSASQALYTLDFDQIRALRPDLIVTQTLCDVCAVDDREVRAFLSEIDRIGAGQPPRVVYLEPTRFGDVLDNIQQVADAAGCSDAGRELNAALRVRVEQVRAVASSDALPPRVVVLEWLDPLFSCGHWTPELVEIAGGVEPIAAAGARSRQIAPEALREADPDIILIACCGYSVGRTMRDVPAFLAQPEIAGLRCVAAGAVWVTDGSAYFSRPGPRLVDSLEIVARVIHSGRRWPESDVPAAIRIGGGAT